MDLAGCRGGWASHGEFASRYRGANQNLVMSRDSPVDTIARLPDTLQRPFPTRRGRSFPDILLRPALKRRRHDSSISGRGCSSSPFPTRASVRLAVAICAPRPRLDRAVRSTSTPMARRPTAVCGLLELSYDGHMRPAAAAAAACP